ncbi:50S ribosomal protein L29 [bacterium]|nr:MAG: 50S ribosomal protein L29 [bacterium]
MKNLKPADLRGKSVEELEQLVAEERAALFAARRDQVFRRLTDTASLSVRRHNIARALTIIGEKQRGSKA